ncbi:phosphatase PAP2 family protein [Dermacoccus abyssi]|uniref:Phosphatase PAP2 family protein n=1 Tax=Dermacoccus abyssi TaxID=322596 RepID=A0ABX5ZAI3_9MICO|nr:phosphatase PAP2 family protein [Dermacoccus abyssi]
MSAERPSSEASACPRERIGASDDDLLGEDAAAPPRCVRNLAKPVGGRPALLLELFIFWMFFQYFSYAQEHIRGGPIESVRHAHELFDLEKALHIDVELWLNGGLAAVPPLAIAAGYYYGMVLATVPITLALVWWFNPRGFRRLRRLLIATTLPSLLVFWLLPMAPPRFAVAGIVDINAVYNILGGALARDPSRSANLYAAMPSLHCAWSTWVAYALWSTWRHTRPTWARLAWLFPAMTYWNVMATGNHFVLDIVGGVALFLIALVIVRVVKGAEERIWQHESDGPASARATVAASDFLTSGASAEPRRGG